MASWIPCHCFRKGCRPGRPACRAMRRVQESRRPCRCSFVHYPHRAGWCKLYPDVPKAILDPKSYKERI
jgi:hypothetical protein